MAITRQGKTVEQLIEQQTFYFDSYRRVWNKYQGNIASTTSVRYAQGKKVSLENLWSLFQANHRQIMDNPEPSSPAVQGYIQGGLYEELEDIVAQSLAQIEEDPLVIAKLEASSKVDDENESNISEDEMQTQRQNQTKVKLPEIKLPHFSGELKHWVAFKDLFLALVHYNSRLSDIERLQYLRVSLKGEAEDFIKRFALSDANYKPAWEQLTARYDNVTALIDANLKTLFSIPKFKEDKSINIRELLDVPSQAIEAIRQLGFPLGDLDPVLVFIIKDRMPLETRRLWEQQAHSPTSYATWTELQVFLETRFRSLNALEPDSGKSIKYNDSGAWAAKTKRTHFMRTKGDACACCGGQHSLYQCEQFLTLSQPERFKIIKEHHLCINCLARDHAMNNCTSNKVCRTCSKRHHTLLHRTETPKSDSRNTSSQHSDREEEIAVSTQVDGNKSRAVSCLAQAPPVKTILLATARVTLVNSMGQTYVCRALLDQGSQASIISERAAQLLQLRRERSSTEIVGIGNPPPSKTRGVVRFVMQVNSPTEELQIEAYVLKKLTNWLPTETIPLAICDGIQGIQLADPNFGIPGRIDVILGADIFGKLLLSGVRTNLPGNLIAQQTKLGWILSGSLTDTGTSGPSKGNAHSNATIVSANCLTLTEVVQRFWELEDVPLETAETEEDRYCEEYYVKTTKRLEDGRYEVSLPWKSNKEDLGLGRSTAINRYLHLERRFAREPALKLKYQECLEDYVQQEHLEKVDLQEIHASAASYLPHHGITKRDDPSGRIRVVFDASQRTESGLSLNDVLYTGPALQNDIRQIITRWRVHKMVFTTDIKNMYRQISITKPDREYQRIVWKRDEESEAQDWRLTRVTFGVSAAPYFALRTLRQLVEDAGHDFPLASSIIRKDTYVDDIMSGADDLDGAELRVKELNQLLESGKFKLHKWTTNDSTVLQTIDKANKESTSAHSIGTSTITKTLGLRWDAASDYFFYRSSMSDTEMDVVTKRRILSEVSQIYDPLGWIAPIVIVGKILLQELWLRGVGWDASLPDDLILRWSKFREGFKTLETIRIPRWFGTLSSEEITLVGFCDASQDAYGAVVYVRQGNLDYNGRTTLRWLL